MRKSEESLKDIRMFKKHIMGVPEEEERKGQKVCLER